MPELGNRLKALRLKHNLTQAQVAERLGISKAVVSSYEVASRYPSYDVLVKLAFMYGVTTDFLLGLDNRKMIDVSTLTPNQINAIEAVISSYKKD